MATITVDRDPKHSDGLVAEGPVGVDIIYGGCMLLRDTTSSGYLYDGDQPAADMKFAGVAFEGVNNSAGSAGDKKVRFWQRGEFEFNIASTDQSCVGKAVYLSTNNEVTLTPGQYAIYIGTITRFVSATKVRVLIGVDTDRPANAIVPIGSTAPLQFYQGSGAFTTTGVTKAVSAGGLTKILFAVVTPVLDAGAAAANGQLSFTEDAALGLPEISGGNVTVVRIAGTDSGLKFVYALFGY